MTNKSNQDIDKYFTIESNQQAEIKIKGSKFIGYAASVGTKDESISFLEQIRAKHFDATHNCFAYQIGWNGSEYRFSDDGEPSGSAGRPILFSIQKYKYSDIIVVVTRYFGGTKLGVGGLVRAYSDATEAVLDLCVSKTINRTNDVDVFCRYEELSIVKRIINETAVSFMEEYTDAVKFTVKIPISKTDDFINQISTSTNTKSNAKLIAPSLADHK